MINYFLDTSAFIRLYVVEPGSRQVRDMVRSATRSPTNRRVLVSEFILPESMSALFRIATSPDAAKKGLSRSRLAQTYSDVRKTVSTKSGVTIIGTAGMMISAASLVEKHQLKAGDALHLATALLMRSWVSGPMEFYFVSCDRRLNAAAVAEGLDVIDPG